MVGKSAVCVVPVIYAIPTVSTAIPAAQSLIDEVPPTNVEYTRAEPVASSFVTNGTVLPNGDALVGWYASGVVGKAVVSC